MTNSGDEDALLRAILADPGDETLRLVYADWLEERGDRRSEVVRIEAVRRDRWQNLYLDGKQRQFRAGLDAVWLALVSRTGIENCSARFGECPERWEKLQPTRKCPVRFCGVCKKKVYYCTTLAEAQQKILANQCIAVDAGVKKVAGWTPFGVGSFFRKVDRYRPEEEVQDVPEEAMKAERKRCERQRQRRRRNDRKRP